MAIINESENKRNEEKALSSLAITSNALSNALGASLNERETNALKTFGRDAIPFIQLARVDKVSDWSLAAHLYTMGQRDFKEPINGIKYKGLGEYAEAISDMLGVKMDKGKASNYRKIHDVFCITDPADIIADFNENNGYTKDMVGLYMTDERYLASLRNWAFNALILLTRTGLKTPEMETFAITTILAHPDGMKIAEVKKLVESEKEKNKTDGNKKKRQLVEKLSDGDGESLVNNDNNSDGNSENTDNYDIGIGNTFNSSVDELPTTIKKIMAESDRTISKFWLTPSDDGFKITVIFE